MSSDSSRDRTPPRDVIYDRCVFMYVCKQKHVLACTVEESRIQTSGIAKEE